MDGFRLAALGVLASFAAACGDNSGPVVLDISFDGTATEMLLAYREDSGQWHVPTMKSSTLSDGQGDVLYDLAVRDGYEVVLVCVAPDGKFEVTHQFATREDGDWDLLCDLPFAFPPAPPVFTVVGTMEQPGVVSMWGEASSAGTAPWMYSLPAPAGTHDLIAWDDAGGGHRILIRRDQLVSSDMTQPTIDLASSGEELVPLGVTVTGVLSGEELTAESELNTSHGSSILPVDLEPAATVWTVPHGLLDDGEFQTVHFETAPPPSPPPPPDTPPPPPTPFLVRDVFKRVSETGPTSIALLPRLDSFSYSVEPASDGHMLATWGPLPVSDYTLLGINFDVNGNWGELITSKRWLDAHHGSASLTFDNSAPGYEPAWILDVNHGYGGCFSIVQNRDSYDFSETGKCDAHPASVALVVDLGAIHAANASENARTARVYMAQERSR